MKKILNYSLFILLVFLIAGCTNQQPEQKNTTKDNDVAKQEESQQNQGVNQQTTENNASSFQIEIERQKEKMKEIEKNNQKALEMVQKTNIASVDEVKANQEKAAAQTIANNIKQLRTKLELYYNEKNSYPENLEALYSYLQGKKTIPLVDAQGVQFTYTNFDTQYELCFYIAINYEEYYKGGNCINDRGQIRRN